MAKFKSLKNKMKNMVMLKKAPIEINLTPRDEALLMVDKINLTKKPVVDHFLNNLMDRLAVDPSRTQEFKTAARTIQLEVLKTI